MTGLAANPAGWLHKAALWTMLACWLTFGAVAWRRHVWVHRERRRIGAVEEPALRSRASMWGLLLEAAAYVIVWVYRRPYPETAGLVWTAAGMLLAPASVGWFIAALYELGRHFRIKAVVAADHELITTGPYRFVRHPIYASMLGLLLANAAVVARWESALWATAVYILGTEIRVRAEDRLLARRFPETFPAYRARVAAYVPFLR